MTDTVPPEWLQIPAKNPHEPWTPRDCEETLTRLFNAVAQAELAMRKLLEQQADAKLALERAHVIAATDPRCPQPTRKEPPITVDQRDDWIRGMEEDEALAFEYSKLNVEMQKRYMERLSDQISMVQSIQKNVLMSYQNAGSYPNAAGSQW